MGSRFFIDDYCGSLFPKAVRQMELKNYGAALVMLKELHDLKFANVRAYLLAARAFLETGHRADALKIAREVWSDFSGKISKSEAETLGDIFLDLHESGEAQKAYELALASDD